MVKMDTLKEFLRIVLYTGYIKNEKPINILIVGKPESGKSAVINRLVTNKGTIELTDISAFGISKMIIPLIRKGIKVKHIIIPDFLVVLAKAKSTVDRTLTFLNALTEEGIVNIGTYLNRGIEFRTDKTVKREKVRCGIITAMTTNMYAKKKKKMNEFGFLSRFVVVRYTYSNGYLQKIFKNIFYGNYLDNETDDIVLPKKEVDIEFEDEKIFNMIARLMINKVAAQHVEGYGIRLTKMAKTLMKAIALKNGRKKVIQEDLDEFMIYEPLINYSGGNIITIDE